MDELLKLIGNTPLYKIDINNNKVYLKLEKFNLTGSSKDRAAKEIILDYLENKSKIYKGIICVTSFNLGYSLAVLCNYYKINLILIMNNNNDLIKMKYFNNLNVKILNYPKKSFNELNTICKKISKLINYYDIDQFNNKLNIKANTLLASEINTGLNKNPDYIFCGIGSGGTLAGLRKYFDKRTTIVGIKPNYNESLPGLNNEFIPYNLNNIEFIKRNVSLNNAITYQNKLLIDYGVACGISTGAIFFSLMKFVIDNNIVNKTIICICPDGMDRYLDV